jgi:ATP-dependent helicase/nuclease subunit B
MRPTFDAAVRQLLAEQGERLPDLSGVTVLVPHHHCAQGLLVALRRQVAAPVFLPPRLTTLPGLAASQAVEIQTDGQRLVALYDFLTRTDWLEEAARWPLAQALLDLLHEIDDARLAPPADYQAFAGQIEQAARRALSAPLEQEARLVFDLWRAFHKAGPGSRGGYALALGRWLDQAEGPVYALGLAGLSRMEEHFLARCRDRLGLVDLAVAEPWPERRALFETAWHGGEGLRERALAWAQAHPASPLALELLGAPDLEAEARAVADRMKDWLAEGRRDIAVIALDRLAARRLRAVLERDLILMQDETGWTFSTATVSHVLDRWFALLQDGFYHRDLFDFLKSPYLFADLPAAPRLAAVAELERLVGHHDVVAGLERFQALAAGAAPLAAAMLGRLAVAARHFRAGRQTLTGWLETLFRSLDEVGATPAFRADPAGRQLLDLLHRLAAELAGNHTPYTLARWRGWLNLQLDRATFQAGEIDSPIRLTHLAAARLRDFDAVVVLGGDAAHLPPGASGELFSDAARMQLGLPGQRQRRDETLADLIEVLSRADRALVTWQAWRGAEPNPRSPWLDRLAAFHTLAHGDDLTRMAPAAASAPGEAPPAAVPPSLADLPTRLSASAWQTLVSCPYRWFARYGLGLGEQEEVAEAMEKADYGERVHDILRRFHEAHADLTAWSRADLEADLVALSETAFRSRERDDYLALAWRLRWRQHIPAYLDWAVTRAVAGRHWQESEAVRERELALADGRAVTLYGRLDRIDQGPDGLEVLDYKTQSRAVLRARLKEPGEDVQLPFYGLLTGAARAGLVALDDDRVDVAEMQRPLAEAVAEETVRLRDTLERVAAGAPLSAHGAPATCRWCEMRGLCRRE